MNLIKEKAIEKAVEGVITLFSHCRSHLTRINNVESNLEELNDTRLRIDALLTDAEQRRSIHDDSVHLWLSDLKSLSFDFQDLLDHFNSLNHHHPIIPNPTTSRKRKRISTFFTNKQIADRIDKLRERYAAISKDRNNLVAPLTPRSFPISLSFQESSIRSSDGQVYGRETEVREIVAALTSSGFSGDLQVVSVTGCGGIGKTTVARAVFDDEVVMKRFGTRIWVGLSQGFDVSMTTKRIIESGEKECCPFSSLDLLQYRLKDIVREKRFLIVLDNVWNEEIDFWWRLRVPLVGNGVDGSRVLVTSRSERVSLNMQAMRSFSLKGLPVEDCHLMFCQQVFARGEGSADLVKIGFEIVDKCQGSPVLVKSMASLLYSVTEEDKWRWVLEDMRHMPEHAQFSDVIMRTLRVSYEHLPLHLKHCFAFCSIFPVGYEFDKDELVRLWMALGFILPFGRRRLEDIGDRYFTDLFSRSFFQSSDSHQSKERPMYKMSSLIHDLSKLVSKFECGVIDNDEVIISDRIKRARYIMFNQCSQEHISLEKVFDSSGLRALMLDGKGGLFTNQILFKLFEKLKYLRVLDLSNSQLEELPDSIDKLILLQYLNLTGTEIMTLPESVGNLYNLKTLELRKCHQLIELPDSIGNLEQLEYLGLHSTEIERLPESVSSLCNLQTLELGMCKNLIELSSDLSRLAKLRHLGLHIDWKIWDRGTNLMSMPLGIGVLTSLQTLSRFVVGPQNERGIGVLKDLNLRGELCITNLENVHNPSDAKEANLLGKSCIDSLMLRWSDVISRNGCADQVIGCLCPHQNLKHLWIENYKGDKFPDWMQDYYLTKLKTLTLVNCSKCKSLPIVGNFSHLEVLHIEGLHGVEDMDHAFTNSEDPNQEGKNDDMAQCSELTISDCTSLKSLCYLPPTLEKLEIRNCPKLNWQALPQLLNLRDLVVVGGDKKTIEWIEQLPSLSSLTISQFSIDEFCPKFSSLEYLKVSFCPKFPSISGRDLPATLKELQLDSCESLSSSTGLDTLNCLNRLEILNVPRLISLTAIPHGLQNLTIRGCPILQIRCQEGGEDWPVVQNVPSKIIESSSPFWLRKVYMAFMSVIRS